MSDKHLLIEDADAATIITLNRPTRRNALSSAMIDELQAAFASVRRTVILAATGPAFCAGHDLHELETCSRADADLLFQACSSFMLNLRRLPVAVIAEVQGMATAAGCQLVAACDLAVAADTAQFATPGVRIGLFCTTPAVPVIRSIGPKRAMQMLLTGSAISAATALEWGLVNRVVPASELRSESLRLAAEIACGSPEAIACGKAAVYDGAGVAEPDSYARACEVMVENLTRADAHEGISAFLARRRPVWPSSQND
jgi:enoyl-CoA hydratase/carnithine racemase